jgi:hypothetical protein
MNSRWIRGYRTAVVPKGVGNGSSAPNDAEFVVLGLNSHLTSERVLTGTPGVIELTDNGPNSSLIIDVDLRGIDFARLQAVSSGTILGRSTAGAGSVEELTVGPGLQLSGGVLSATAASNVFSATCLATDLVGNFAYVTGPYAVTTVDISDSTKIPTIGVIISKSTPTTCVVQWHGEVSGLYVGLIPGKMYFVGSDGRPSATVPVIISGYGYIQKIGVGLNPSTLLVMPSLELVKRYA